MNATTRKAATTGTAVEKALPYQRMRDSRSAARLLHHHLGETVEHWIDYLRQDRAEAFDSPEECGIPWIHERGEFYYAEADLYGYVHLHNPTALGLDDRFGAVERSRNSFECTVEVDVDFAHRGRLMVHLFTEKTCEGARPWLTPDAARVLANKLETAAAECEQYHYDFLEGKLLRRTDSDGPVPGAPAKSVCHVDQARSEIAAAERGLYLVKGGA